MPKKPFFQKKPIRKIRTLFNVLRGKQLTEKEMMKAFNNKSRHFHYDPKTHTYIEIRPHSLNTKRRIFDGNTGKLIKEEPVF